MRHDEMNFYETITYVNIGLFACVVLVAFATKSPWALLGLLFMISGKTDDSSEIDELKELVDHMYVYSNYQNCGYDKMTKDQQELYDSIVTDTN
jgi:hypothetical protein